MRKATLGSTNSASQALVCLFALTFAASVLAGPPKPQIPKEDFEWTGRFLGNSRELGGAKVEYDLTVKGKWQNGYFNLYMSQGNEGEDTWVENLIYEDKLYSITHAWHIDDPDINGLLGICFQNMVYNKEQPYQPEHISVDDFNKGLRDGATLVGLEKIGGKPVNHFRHSCLAQSALQLGPFIPPIDPDNPPDDLAALSIPFKVFSDIYVPAGRQYPWLKWLQFGDGVGPDPHHDEWFVTSKTNGTPDTIILPEQCQLWNAYSTLLFVQQTTCKNLVVIGEPEVVESRK